MCIMCRCVCQDTDLHRDTPASVALTCLSHDHFLSVLCAESSTRRPSTCFHPLSRGQELCYVCHQRALANIPVSFAEERKQREKLEDQLLQEYLQKKDTLETAKDKVCIRHKYTHTHARTHTCVHTHALCSKT